MRVYRSLSDRLETQHEAIEIIISVINNERLFKRPQPDKWNIHDNIAHLAKYQPVFIDRINKILFIKKPLFERYRAEDDSEFKNWRTWNTIDLIKRLAIERQEIFKLITNLSETELSRIGIHSKYGQLNILQWTEFYLLHEAHHIFTIFQLANNTEY